MKPRALLTTDTRWTQGVHAKCIHLHFDINGDRREVEKYLSGYLEKHADLLEWDPFFLPTEDQLSEIYAGSGCDLSDEIRQLLCDPAKYGAPQAHLSAKHFHGNIYEKQDGGLFDFQKLLDLYTEGCEVLKSSPFSGYVEVEDALEEVLLPASDELLIKVDVPPLTAAPIQKVSLESLQEVCGSDSLPYHYRETGRRWFRTTEIHVSFDDITKVDPRVIARFLESGFYSAFKRRSGSGKVKFIATIQGFEHEICKLRAACISFLQNPKVANSVSCAVALKKEDIMMFLVFGDKPSVQQVVCPDSPI